MTKEQRFDEFWAKYRALNSTGKMKALDSYFKAEKKWMKRNDGKSGTDFDAHVLHSLLLLGDYRKRLAAAREFVPSWTMAATYLNQERYDDEFVGKSSSELVEMAKAKMCACGKPVEIQTICADCYSEKVPNRYKDELKARHQKHLAAVPKLPNDDWREWSLRVNKYFGYNVNVLPKPRKRLNEPKAVTEEEFYEKYGVKMGGGLIPDVGDAEIL